jgi:thiosulfate dehydrogenase [quinone] large subunit
VSRDRAHASSLRPDAGRRRRNARRTGGPVGQAASFNDPATGDPSIVIQPRSGQFVAFDTVCPHAGCTVGYDPAAKAIICPCHGSQFNASTGAVEVGPAATGLKTLAIAEGSNGQLYVT